MARNEGLLMTLAGIYLYVMVRIYAWLRGTYDRERLCYQDDELTKEELAENANGTECFVLYEPKGEIYADVIFIHGMYGSTERTWRTSTTSEPSYGFKIPKRTAKLPPRIISNIDLESFIIERKMEGSGKHEGDAGCWPKDWLPLDMPGVRVLSLEFKHPEYFHARFWHRPRLWKKLKDRADDMINKLIANKVGDRPILWCGHSKGGLYIKQILVNASERPNGQKLVEQTKGFMMMSVPHWGVPYAICEDKIVGLCPEFKEVLDLEMLNRLHEDFMEIYKKNMPDALMVNLLENLAKRFGPFSLKTVPFSANDVGFGPLLGLDTTHAGTCKALSRYGVIYASFLYLAKRSLPHEAFQEKCKSIDSKL